MDEHTLVVAALVVAGYLLIAVEVFVIPGFGIAGIAGLISLGAGSALAFMWMGPVRGTIVLVVIVASTTAFFVWIPRSRYGRVIVHGDSLASARSSGPTVAAGEEGVAESDLRPAGIARFGDARESVVADGEFIASGTRLRVVRTEGSRVVVESVDGGDDRDVG